MARSAIAQSSASPSLIVYSIARPFGTGSAPGCARHTGHVSEFSCAPYSSAQRQNIFVRVFRCACTSRPMTGSQSDIRAELLRLADGSFDVVAHLHHCEPVLERRGKDAHEPQLALARLERELEVVHEHCARAVEHARPHAEDALDRGDEVGRWIFESHRSRSGTTSNAIACSSACPTRKSAFSENCGPISCNPTGRPSERPHGMFSPGSPAMHEGMVRRSDAYIASGSAVRPPSSKATVGDVGVTSTSKRSNASACSRAITVRTFCAWP